MARGARDEDVLASIVGSQEYFNREGATSDAYVRSLYRTVLRRVTPPTQAEVDFWIAQLAVSKRGAVQARVDIALGFQYNDEYRALLVNDWYQVYLGRTPDSQELESALDALRVGATQETVQAAILVSR